MAQSTADRSVPDDFLVDRWRILLRLQILSAIGFFLILLYGLRFWSYGDVVRIVGVATLAAGASLTSGFLLGFIFGIPRDGNEPGGSKGSGDSNSSNDPNTRAPRANSNRVKPNSNLIEISDWLTKIIVGVGLVELKSIPAKLGTLSYYLGHALRPAACNGSAPCTDFIDGGKAVGLAICIFYVTLGFLMGYVWTRLKFTSDLEEMEALKRDKENLERVKKNLEQDKENLQKDNEHLQQSKDKTDFILGAESLMKERRLVEALQYIDKVLENDPQDGPALMTKARILKRQATEPGVMTDEWQKLLKEALDYVTQAIPLMPGKGEPLYNKACYQALLGVDLKEILANLKSAFSLSPGLKKTAAEDEDFSALRQNYEFQQLISSSGGPDR